MSTKSKQTVVIYSSTTDPSGHFLRLLEYNHFNHIKLEQDQLSKSTIDNGLALIYLPKRDMQKLMEYYCSKLPVTTSMLFVSSKSSNILPKALCHRQNCDILVPPFEDDDIIFALRRLYNMYQIGEDVDFLKTELNAKRRMIKVYRGLTKSLTSTLNLKQLLNKVKEKNSRLLQCSFLSLYLYNSHTLRLEYMKTRRRDQHQPSKTSFEIGEGLPGLVFKLGRKIVANQPFSEAIKKKLKGHYPFNIQNICCMPLKFKDRYLGVIEAVNKNDGSPFDDNDLVVLQILVDHAAIAIENSMLYERVQKLTIVDDLTQAYNFRFFNMMLVNEFNRAERFLRPLSLLFLDLDGFKRVNDQYGHMIGSKVLREIAAMIKKTVRKSDVVSRFGGDEFTVILPNTSMDGAQRVARRIQQEIETFHYDISSWDIDLSVSIGISSFPEHVRTKDQLLKVADKAMYKIKENQKKDVSIGMLSHDDIQKLALTTTNRNENDENY